MDYIHPTVKNLQNCVWGEASKQKKKTQKEKKTFTTLANSADDKLKIFFFCRKPKFW